MCVGVWLNGSDVDQETPMAGQGGLQYMQQKL